MSWGERSCKFIGNCPFQGAQRQETCDVDCPAYAHNGRKPDSKPVDPDKRCPKCRSKYAAKSYFDGRPFACECGWTRSRDRRRLCLVRETEKISRNAPCPCGSGLKFKKCCMK